MKVAPSYASIVCTAAIAGVFSLVVASVLVTTHWRHRPLLALDDPEYQTLRLLLEQDPANVQRQEQLHRWDANLRLQYFRQQDFLRRGTYLLTGGIVMTLLLAHWASSVRRRLPRPKAGVLSHHAEHRANSLAQGTIGGLALLLAIMVVSRAAFTSALGEAVGTADRARGPQPTAGGSASFATAVPSTSTVRSDQGTREGAGAIAGDEFLRSWPRFRGIGGAGTSVFKGLPTAWNGTTGEGILWKVPVPLPGVSSPIVWQDRIYLTGATQDRREVYCFSVDDGRLLWQRAVGANVPSSGLLKVSAEAGYAAPTPATDGRSIYAIFARGDLVAFDLDGEELWYANLGPLQNSYGHASSLTTFEDLLIVQLDQGRAGDGHSKLTARRGLTGEVVWETKRDVSAAWTSPIVVEHEGQWQIVTCADPGVIAYAADTGREIWRANCLDGELGPSPVYHDGTVYVANDGAVLAAIDAGGQGDVTDSHIRWTADYALPDISSPLVADRYVLLVSSYGTLAGYDRIRGSEEPLWEVEIDGVCTASPCLVGDLVYLIGEDGKGGVFTLSDVGCERVANNELGERCFASPAFQQHRIYMRGEHHLFCIGKSQD